MPDRDADPAWQRLLGLPPRAPVDPGSLESLPLPAQRLLVASIAPGASLPSRVVLHMTGEIRLKLDGKWLPFTARQVLAPPAGFIWRATVGAGLFRFSGSDRYVGNSASVRFKLWGVLPVVNASGSDVVRSARHRLAAESFWLPPSLLPGSAVTWRAIDDAHAEACVLIDDERIPVRLRVDPRGQLRTVQLDRWGDPDGTGHPSLHPFGGEVDEPRAFGPFTIPTRVRVGWFFGTARQDHGEFFRATVHAADFG